MEAIVLNGKRSSMSLFAANLTRSLPQLKHSMSEAQQEVWVQGLC